jgi:hypothetical protein
MFGQLKDRINLQLVETRTFGSGVVLLRYQYEPAYEPASMEWSDDPGQRAKNTVQGFIFNHKHSDLGL